MTILRRALLASAIAGVGLASTAGAALATENDSHDTHGSDDTPTSQQGFVNVGDVQTIVPANVCNNDVPVNALGVQVPVQDLGLDIPLLSSTHHDATTMAKDTKACGSGVAADD